LKIGKEWHDITFEEIVKHGGRTILSRLYHGSAQNAILSTFSEFEEKTQGIFFDWVINHLALNASDSYNVGQLQDILTGNQFWQQKKNQRIFFDWVGKQLGFNSFEDWYNITQGDIIKQAGQRLLQRYYNGSLVCALLSVYPEYNWLPWKFSHLKRPDNIWGDQYDVALLSDIAKQLGVSKLTDWYRVSKGDLLNCNAGTFLMKRGGLMKVLSLVFPNFLWDQDKFLQRQKRTSQWWLYKILKEILPPHIEVFEDFTHPFLKLKTGCLMIFDIYVPSLNLVFEYHGHQHFTDHLLFGETKFLKERDSERYDACNSLGVTDIEIPYWWQRDKESIIAVLNKHRADIVSNNSQVIPFFYKTKGIM